MKTKTVGTSLLTLACGVFLSCVSARACTVFCYGEGDTVLAGRSFDIPSNPNLGMLLVPATNSAHGWLCCGYIDYPWADGMNDQGLFAALADVPTPYTSKSSQQPADVPTFMSGLLGSCATVEEAIAWCSKQPTPSLGASPNHSDQDGYTFVTPQHILVADRTGDSVVFEWPQGKLKMTRKKGRYQLMTNFLLSDPEAGGYPCPRFIVDSRILDKAAGPSLQTFRQVLETTAVGTTRYSLICDLTHGDVNVYLRRGFDQPKTIHLADELQKGRHEIDLDEWFGRPKPEPLSPPPVIAPSTVPASEILRRALAARGGEKAAREIQSIHVKGTADLDVGCLPPAPLELFAMRPNRFRIAVDVIVPAGPNLGEYIEGYDGGVGWNSNPGSVCNVLKGNESELRQDSAGFFGWYDEPGWYEGPGSNATAECLGEAEFDGKLCYDLKVVSPSHHEYFEYYEKANFLLAGGFAPAPTQGEASWIKTTFGDYRAVDGFLLPMRIVSQDDKGRHQIQFSTVEINTVKEKDLRMVEKVAGRRN